MRPFFSLILIFIIGSFLLGCAKTAATVNGQRVTQKDLDRELEKAGGKNMLESLISKKLVEQDAAAKHITVAPEEVNQQLNEIKKGLTPVDLQTMTGEKLQQVREEVHFNILLRKAITSKISENDIRAYYEKNKDLLPEVELSVIVVSDPRQAAAILADLQRGKDFATLAGEFSLDPAGRARSGYVGYLSKGNLQQLSPALAQAAFSLKSDQVSPVIKAPRGYYILKVLNKRETYDQLKNQIERQMASDRAKTYLDDLREKAKIDYKGEYVKK